MHKRYPRRVQIQPIRTTAVKVVAFDWTIEAFRVGAVHAELVSAACERVEFHNVFIDHEILGNGRFSILFVHLLERTVHQVGRERQFDATFCPYWQRFAL